jgi:hypothetical protein
MGSALSYLGINGVQLILQPATQGWVSRDPLDIDGNGHPIYPSVRQYEMNWEFIDENSFGQILGFWTTQSLSGSVVATLPYWQPMSGTYMMNDYTGCVLYEPQGGDYFMGYRTNVKLLIGNIRT